MTNDALIFFADTFVRKDKRKRCADLIQKNTQTSWQKLSLGLPHGLSDDTCHYYSNNACEHYYHALLHRENAIALVCYFSSLPMRSRLRDYEPDDFTDALVIVPDAGVAFLFHHHGGLWICCRE